MRLSAIYSRTTVASIYLVMMCIQLVGIEGLTISPLKVYLMAFAPLFFILNRKYFSNVFLWGMLYWAICFFSASYKEDMRFSTVGYLGMFIITFVVYHNFIYSGVFSLDYFLKLLRVLIMAYAIMLIIQQLSVLLGLNPMLINNLSPDSESYSIDKLPSLSLEPSHSARILTALMLSYIRGLEIFNSKRITFGILFNKQNRVLSILFVWTMLTMGSATAFLGLGLLSIYFIQRKTYFYMVPILIVLFLIAQVIGMKQMERAVSIVNATMTGDTKVIEEADGSASARITPVINTVKNIDLEANETWFGKGTRSEDWKTTWMENNDRKLDLVEQYGLIAFIISLIFVYSTMIRNFLSIESLIFIFLLSASLVNLYYTWAIMMLFATIRYFQQQNKYSKNVL